MLVLALDTATTRMTAGVVELSGDPAAGVAPVERAVRVGESSRAHAEHLAPWIRTVVAEAGTTLDALDAVVCGCGPGPFTGLRVGMVTASALGSALGVPVHPVVTHDALAWAAPAGGVLAVTDARRREVYWAVVVDGVRRDGPAVGRPDDVAAMLTAPLTTGPDGGLLTGIGVVVGDAADVVAPLVGLPAGPPPGPTPAGLVAVAAADLLAARGPGPLVPRYLRRPDAVPPGAPKAVSRP